MWRHRFGANLALSFKVVSSVEGFELVHSSLAMVCTTCKHKFKLKYMLRSVIVTDMILRFALPLPLALSRDLLSGRPYFILGHSLTFVAFSCNGQMPLTLLLQTMASADFTTEISGPSLFKYNLLQYCKPCMKRAMVFPICHYLTIRREERPKCFLFTEQRPALRITASFCGRTHYGEVPLSLR